MLKLSEIKSWDDTTITNKVSELKTELFNYRMQKTTSGLDKPHKVKEAKKTIARLLTTLNSRREK